MKPILARIRISDDWWKKFVTNYKIVEFIHEFQRNIVNFESIEEELEDKNKLAFLDEIKFLSEEDRIWAQKRKVTSIL